MCAVVVNVEHLHAENRMAVASDVNAPREFFLCCHPIFAGLLCPMMRQRASNHQVISVKQGLLSFVHIRLI